MVNNLADGLAKFNKFVFKWYYLLIFLATCMKFVALIDTSNHMYPLVQSREVAKTIKINEDKMDCVNILEQPAFKNPYLKDHKIQMKSRIHENVWKNTKPAKSTNLFSGLQEIICPKGTVPIKRHTNGSPLGLTNEPTIQQGTPQYAGYEKQGDMEFVGVHGALNLWAPYVAEGDYSATIVSVGISHNGQLTSLSSGWMVNQQVFEDLYPRMFAYYTNDDHVTACYSFDPNCSGFVIATRRTALNRPITRVSTYQSRQFDIDVKIIQDNTTKNWWLNIGDEEVGYWPSNLVPWLQNGASFVRWGGEVLTTPTSIHPPSMGSGWGPETGHQSASFISNVQYVNKHYQAIDGTDLQRVVTQPARYNVSELKFKTSMRSYFFYGGS